MEDGDIYDEFEQSEMQIVKRTVEQKFRNLEALMNKKIVKGINQLSTDTRARMEALKQETKVKMTQVQKAITSENKKKMDDQSQHIEEVKEYLAKEISNVIKTNKTENISIIRQIGR